MKTIMKHLYKIELELNYDLWRNYQNNGILAESKRRMLMALWASKAWGVLSKDKNIIKSSFEDTVFIGKSGHQKFKIPTQPRYSPPL